MATVPKRNKNVNQLPTAPSNDPRAAWEVDRALTEGLQSLFGDRGNDRAVLFSDLYELGIVYGTFPNITYSGGSGGGGTVTPLPPVNTGIPEAPMDGYAYARCNGAWVRVLMLSGGTMTGPLILGRLPSQPMEAVPLSYLTGGSVWDDADSIWDSGSSPWDR